MPEASLIVPTTLPSGSLHFAQVNTNGTVKDVIDALLALPDATSEILGELEGHGWALQHIRAEQTGRIWEEHDLESLGDGEP
jgi:diaphanous 1